MKALHCRDFRPDHNDISVTYQVDESRYRFSHYTHDRRINVPTQLYIFVTNMRSRFINIIDSTLRKTPMRTKRTERNTQWHRERCKFQTSYRNSRSDSNIVAIVTARRSWASTVNIASVASMAAKDRDRSAAIPSCTQLYFHTSRILDSRLCYSSKILTISVHVSVKWQHQRTSPIASFSIASINEAKATTSQTFQPYHHLPFPSQSTRASTTPSSSPSLHTRMPCRIRILWLLCWNKHLPYPHTSSLGKKHLDHVLLGIPAQAKGGLPENNATNFHHTMLPTKRSKRGQTWPNGRWLHPLRSRHWIVRLRELVRDRHVMEISFFKM